MLHLKKTAWPNRFSMPVGPKPHQIDAALLPSTTLSKGVVLADEVGLGKTIEAALVLCQLL